MSLAIPKEERAKYREEVRALKRKGFDYAQIGAKLIRNGKPIGKSWAHWFAKPQPGECSGCLRRFGKK